MVVYNTYNIRPVLSSVNLNVYTMHQKSLTRIYFDFGKFQDFPYPV